MSDHITSEEVAELRRLLAAVPQRFPWRVETSRGAYCALHQADTEPHGGTLALYSSSGRYYGTCSLYPEEMDLIAAAVNALPRLLDAVAALKG